MRICQCRAVEVCRAAEPGDGRYPEAQDRASARGWSARVGAHVSEAPLDARTDSYGLFSAAAVQDPYPYYKELREREPVHWSERAQAWYFTRYRDVFELQDRPDLSVDRIETIYSYLPRT